MHVVERLKGNGYKSVLWQIVDMLMISMHVGFGWNYVVCGERVHQRTEPLLH